MKWEEAARRLGRVVVRHLGETIQLAQESGETVSVRGILTDPERVARLGASDFVSGEAMLVVLKSEAPAWLARGVSVTRSSGDRYDVVRVLDNGEGLLEVTLCRS